MVDPSLVLQSHSLDSTASSCEDLKVTALVVEDCSIHLEGDYSAHLV